MKSRLKRDTESGKATAPSLATANAAPEEQARSVQFRWAVLSATAVIIAGMVVAWYDVKSQQFVPYLSGLSAEGVAFSNDGQWVAYASVPEHSLWKSKVHGSERLQLTFPPLQAYEPRWSPDGKKIAFQGITPGQPWKMYLISADGGEPEEVMSGIGDLGWSPDGTSLIFHSGMTDFLSATPRSIHLLDVKTRQNSKISGFGRTVFPAMVARRELHRCASSWSGNLAGLRCARPESGQS